MRAVLVVNAGSSSVKFAGHAAAAPKRRLFRGLIERLDGEPRTRVDFEVAEFAAHPVPTAPPKLDHAGAVGWIVDLVRGLPGIDMVGVGHRVVHGGPGLTAPCRIDRAVEAKIEATIPLARAHNPHSLAAIRAIGAIWPELDQVACFDTAFHATQPELATTFALPRAIRNRGVRRYGFHGLSYQSIVERLGRLKGAGAAAGRIIIAHLGNGASLCAVREGRSVATTMGFTPLDGLIMGTRPGLLDPGVILYLAEEMGLSPREISDLLHTECGLKALSELSGDLRTIAAAGTDGARFAMELYSYRIAREVGSMAAALAGLDGIVFTGGVGEHSVAVRGAVMARLGWLGLAADEAANGRASAAAGTLISAPGSTVTARVLATDEESVIARATAELSA